MIFQTWKSDGPAFISLPVSLLCLAVALQALVYKPHGSSGKLAGKLPGPGNFSASSGFTHGNYVDGVTGSSTGEKILQDFKFF